jgi:hypothetical protein
MVTISNSQRDQAVRYLRVLSAMVKDDSLKAINTRRLALRLAKELAKKEKQ